jgi:hypothetical protein
MSFLMKSIGITLVAGTVAYLVGNATFAAIVMSCFVVSASLVALGVRL